MPHGLPVLLPAALEADLPKEQCREKASVVADEEGPANM